MNPVKAARARARKAVRRALIRYARGGREQTPGRRLTIMLTSPWGMGGTIRSALNLAEYLAARGWEVEILGNYRQRDESFFGAFPPGVKATALHDQRRKRPLESLLARVPSALVHQADRQASAFSLLTDIRLAKALRGRSGFLMGTRPALNFFAAEMCPPGCISVGVEQMHLHHHVNPLKKAMRKHYPRLDVMTVLTETDRANYEAHLGARAPRLEVIPNTVREMEGAKADLDAKVVLAAGRLRIQKGYDMLLESWAKVAPERPGWHLRVCGTGRLRDRLAKQIEALAISDSVTLEGPLQQLGEEMSRASVFPLSSRFEGFPLVLLEAMSKGMAVVAFDCPTGPADIVEDHRNGLLVRPHKDVEAFATALLEITGDDELRRRCGAAAPKTAHRFTMEVIGPRWEALLEDLLAQRAAGAAASR